MPSRGRSLLPRYSTAVTTCHSTICNALRLARWFLWRELAWSDESESHIARHNVAPSEVEQVVNSRPRWEHPGVEESVLVYGRTAASRYLLVVLAESADGRWYVATGET